MEDRSRLAGLATTNYQNYVVKLMKEVIKYISLDVPVYRRNVRSYLEMSDLDTPGEAAGEADSQHLEGHQARRDQEDDQEVSGEPGGQDGHTAALLGRARLGDSLVHLLPTLRLQYY